MKRIFIDPGHGGADPGATGNGLKEKDLTLSLGLLLEENMKNYDCEVKLSRRKDRFLGLYSRAKAANDWNAGLFFSIHINGHNNASANGYEDFVHPDAPQITFDRQVFIHRHISKIWTGANRADRGMKVANFQVLRETQMSAILVENGFITNQFDAALLEGEGFQRQLARAMAQGIAEAMGLGEKKPDVTIEQLEKEKNELLNTLEDVRLVLLGVSEKIKNVQRQINKTPSQM